MDDEMERIKLVVIGGEYTGKTLFIECLITGYNSLDFKKYQYTCGASYASKKFYYNNKNYLIDIWDTAGLQKYISLTKFFFRDAGIIFVFFNYAVKESFEKAKTLVESARTDCENKNVAIILVENKYDLNLSQIKDRNLFCDEEEILSYANKINIPLVHLSIKEKYSNGVNELFKKAMNEYLKKTSK